VRTSGEKRYLVSKLFDVTDSSAIEDTLHTEATQIKVEFGKGIAGTVAQTKQPINIKDAYEVSLCFTVIISFPQIYNARNWSKVQKFGRSKITALTIL